MASLERRYTIGQVELRARDGDKRTIGGYAAKFNRPSQNLGGFIEVVEPTFFNQSRGDGWPDVIARYNHDDNMLLGTSNSGTLRLDIDEVGLLYEVDPPSARRDIVELVERRDVQKSSFAFNAFEDEWAMSDQGFPQRSLIAGHLVDVAPVNSPAYMDTSVGMRSDGALGARVDTSVALRSLADKFDAELEEVRKMAEENGLKKFFVRTDDRGEPAKKLSAAARLAQAKAIKL